MSTATFFWLLGTGVALNTKRNPKCSRWLLNNHHNRGRVCSSELEMRTHLVKPSKVFQNCCTSESARGPSFPQYSTDISGPVKWIQMGKCLKNLLRFQIGQRIHSGVAMWSPNSLSDLRTPTKEGSQRLTKAYPKPALDLTMAPWHHGTAPSGPWYSQGHDMSDMSWPKIDRKIQKIELALEALLAFGSAGLFWLKHTEMTKTLRLAAMDVALQKVLASRSVADTA